MKYEYTCTYCDYKWTTDYKISHPHCIKCKDTNFKVKKLEKGENKNVFGYDEEEEDSSEWNSQKFKWGSD